MPKKIIFAIAILYFFAPKSFSQTEFGIKTGINFCKAVYDNSYVDDVISPYRKLKPGIAAGIFFDSKLNKILTVNAEILYSQKGLKYFQTGFREGINTMNYLEIPISGGYNFYIDKKNIINFYIGGYYAFWIHGKFIYTDLSSLIKYETKVDFNSPDFDYNRHDAGLFSGLKYRKYKSKLSFDLRYTHAMLSSSNAVADGLFNRLLSFSVSFVI